MRVVAALGGNALLRRSEVADAATQRRNVAVAARALGELATDHELIVTHGNGPQIGLLALQSEAYRDVPTYPLDVLGAESEGMIGYMLEQELENVLPDREIATLLTQVEVDPWDRAFATPTKPVGPTYTKRQADELAIRNGWAVAPDGPGWRRVVPSPEPVRIVELKTIAALVNAGVTVICVGGGGVPVIIDDLWRLRGVEAVIDKDLAAALLAEQLGADVLLLLTDVDAVETDHGTPDARPLGRISIEDLRELELPAGSMGPKAEAACRFVEAGGNRAVITSLANAAAAGHGRVGTVVERPSDRRRSRLAEASQVIGRPTG